MRHVSHTDYELTKAVECELTKGSALKHVVTVKSKGGPGTQAMAQENLLSSNGPPVALINAGPKLNA